MASRQTDEFGNPIPHTAGVAGGGLGAPGTTGAEGTRDPLGAPGSTGAARTGDTAPGAMGYDKQGYGGQEQLHRPMAGGGTGGGAGHHVTTGREHDRHDTTTRAHGVGPTGTTTVTYTTEGYGTTMPPTTGGGFDTGTYGGTDLGGTGGLAHGGGGYDTGGGVGHVGTGLGTGGLAHEGGGYDTGGGHLGTDLGTGGRAHVGGEREHGRDDKRGMMDKMKDYLPGSGGRNH